MVADSEKVAIEFTKTGLYPGPDHYVTGKGRDGFVLLASLRFRAIHLLDDLIVNKESAFHRLRILKAI